MPRRPPWQLLALSAISACTGEPDRHTDPQRAPELALGAEASRVELAASVATRRGRELLLDVDATRALSATPGDARAPALAFVPLRVVLSIGDDERTLAESALDARLVPRSDAVLLLAGDRTLWRWTPAGATPLDDQVVPGLAVSPDGRRAAYAKGQLPELDVWELELDGGEPRAAASGDGPEHAPTYSADGARLAWIDYRTGGPALVSSGTTILPQVAVVPDGRRVPIWRDGWVLLHGQAGTVAVREGTGAPLLELGAATDVSSHDGGAVRAADGRWRALVVGGAR